MKRNHSLFEIRIFAIILILVVLLFQFSGRDAVAQTRNREGVDVPFTITSQKQQLTHGQFILYAYQLILNFNPGEQGAAKNLNLIERGTFTRQQIFTTFMTTAGTNDNAAFIRRLYQVLLKRTPTSLEPHLSYLNSTIAAGTPKDKAWYNLFNTFIGLPEFGAKNCTTQGWSYGRQLRSGAPSLEDLFLGKARWQVQFESEALTFQTPPVDPLWYQKIPIIYYNNNYIAFARMPVTPNKPNAPFDTMDVIMMNSADGLNFGSPIRVFGDRADDSTPGGSIYDPHIAIDYSYCPKRYIMTTECDGRLCLSETSTPDLKWSWSKPKLVVNGGQVTNRTSLFYNKWLSASTGTTIVDKNGNRYLQWTAINDWFNYPFTSIPDEGKESASTRGVLISSPGWTGFADAGQFLMTAEENTHCTSSWDCNNKDKQDIKYEGGKYYMIYNGANYYRCQRQSGDNRIVDWGISVARSSNPLGNFDADKLGKPIDSESNIYCAVSYPVVNEINGQLYLYYSNLNQDLSRSQQLRSRLYYYADLNLDGSANTSDIITLFSLYGPTSLLRTDLDSNDMINSFDYVKMLTLIGL